MLAAVRAHTSLGGSFVKTSPNQSSTTGLEGFARGALIAAYRAVGSDDRAVRDPLLSWLGQGVDVGTRTRGADSWPRPADRNQAIVEAAWIAIALAETRAELWDQLGDAVRQRIVRWLAQVQDAAVYDNNWIMYPVIVHGFLEQVSGSSAGGATARALGKIDAMHHRDGWYSDGPGACFSHYSAWGIQLLLAHWLRMTGGDAFPGGPQVLRERLRVFLDQYVHLIGGDGGPVLHGRSLVYRFAAAAPLWHATLLDASPFPHGVTRRIASGVLRHFVVGGALDDGIPPVGWYGSFPAIGDPYTTPVSSLLAGEAFVGLLLPPEHGAWTDVEAAGPADGTVLRTLSTPGFVCMGTRHGVLRVASHGASGTSVAFHPGFRRIGYSNRTAPATGGLGELDVDGQVTIVREDGTALRRRGFTLLAAGDRFATSTWVPEPSGPSTGRRPSRVTHKLAQILQPRVQRHSPTRDVRVETTSVARTDMELRITHFWSLDGGVIRDGGLALSHDDPPVVSRGDGWCAATTTDGLTSAVVGLYGWGDSGWVGGLDASPFGRHSVVPYVDGDGNEPEAVLITAHLLTFDQVDPDQLRAESTVEVLGHRIVTVRFGDGEHFLVQLYRPIALRVRIGEFVLDGVHRYARSSPDGNWSLPWF